MRPGSMEPGRAVLYEEDIDPLKIAYEKAVKNNEDYFTLHTSHGDLHFYTRYAMYLLEYLKMKKEERDGKETKRKGVKR